MCAHPHSHPLTPTLPISVHGGTRPQLPYGGIPPLGLQQWHIDTEGLSAGPLLPIHCRHSLSSCCHKLDPVPRPEGRALARDPLVEVDIAKILWRLLRGADFLVVIDHPSVILLDMTDIMATHSGGTHVTDEGKKLVFSRSIAHFWPHRDRFRDGFCC